MNTDSLLQYLLQFYRENEFPVLLRQYEAWRKERPFEGIRLLDATPVFRNTFAKYLPLLAGGADLTVGFGEGLPSAPGIRDLLNRFGISCKVRGTYDAVMDCAGCFRNVPVRSGYVELTRSGYEFYRNCPQKVFFADAGKIKTIETGLGTGDGFRRGLAELGYREIRGRRIVIFGYGKVGRGIALSLLCHGAVPVIVDDLSRVAVPETMEAVDRFDRAGVERALENAWCMVSVTGVAGALEGTFDPEKLMKSPILIANMGVEDEFGPAIPEERVLNRKKPLNFLCEEPTRIMYIDPTMALSNLGAWKLIRENSLQPGINRPAPEDEKALLDVLMAESAAAPEVARLA